MPNAFIDEIPGLREHLRGLSQILGKSIGDGIEYRYTALPSATDAQCEYRCELRADEENAMTIRGMAIPFNEFSEPIFGMFHERISPRSVVKTLREFDQVALWSHRTDKPLGRKSRGTLKLEADERGVNFWNLLPENTWGRDAHISIQRGDTSQMSFGFNVIEDRLAGEHNGLPVREILEMRLVEVSPVVFPAYRMTDTQARSILTNLGHSDTPPDPEHTEPPVDDHGFAEFERELMRCRLELAEIEL